ncbi:MAG: mechanosensitive ion channel [Acidiferrobacterales bacterium]|nr:mechanosensitive ion channel [Acidiferrobacterales bacterium]
MEKIYDWTTPLNVVSGWFEGFIDFLPNLIGAFILLFIGWLVSRLVRTVVVRLIKGLDRFSGKIRFIGIDPDSKLGESSANFIGSILYWFTFLIFITSAASLLGMNMFAGWLSRLVDYLPNILSGVLIVGAGVIFSNLIFQAVLATKVGVSDSQRTVVARGAQFFFLLMLVLIGVNQIGIDITVIVIVMSVVIGALLGGLSIAFSLGARTLVSNLIGIRYLNPDYRVGELIRVGEYEGTVLEINSVSIVLDGEHGRVTIPARILSEQPSILIKQENDDV